MSDVLFAAAVAKRSGTDVETASRVIDGVTTLIRDMALAGAGARLPGVGRFEVRDPGPRGGGRRLAFTPVGSLTKIGRGAP